jgi:hypothetical protein
VGDEEILHGGVANAGAVVRVGDHVLRPSSPQTPLIHRLLRWVRDHGCDGVPDPVGIDADGREHLVYIAGEVPLPPFPPFLDDGRLASTARLLRRYHDAVTGFPTEGAWNTELADPQGGTVICHHDVCPENVVFRDGEAVALLDFEFAAPGRPVYDLASMARMCIPAGPHPRADARLRLVADAYGLDAAGRAELLECLADQIARGGEFVRRRVEAGEQAFIEMWERGGGMAFFDARRRWFADARPLLEAALA